MKRRRGVVEYNRHYQYRHFLQRKYVIKERVFNLSHLFLTIQHLIVTILVIDTTVIHYSSHCYWYFFIALHAEAFTTTPNTNTFLSKHSTRKKSTSTSIMGIRGFRTWFESEFTKSITKIATTTSSTKDDNVNMNTNTNRAEKFDHVLIDLNQYLHVVVRKSRNSDGHALTLLMKELDYIITNVATPTKSIVLAMDGPPSAAKLATQRKRRLQTIVRSNTKLKHIDKRINNMQQQSNNSNNNNNNNQQVAVSHNDNDNNMNKRTKKKMKKKQGKNKHWHRKKRRILSELRTLCITPGTDFMIKVEHAILYWAWQRFTSTNNVIVQNNVKIFFSPSTIPGEGEVKLLEWLYHRPRLNPNESIALLGGDSDLVLEGLMIPLSYITHNVFCILPAGKNHQYWSISLWETTKILLQNNNSSTSTTSSNDNNSSSSSIIQNSIIHLRTDLVVLLILNGNDYLPKLRGSSGFRRLYNNYVKLRNEWYENGNYHCYLVNPDTLEYNIDFCIAYFDKLASFAPSHLWDNSTTGTNITTSTEDSSTGSSSSTTPLSILHNMVAGGYLPAPFNFTIVNEDDNAESQNINDDNDDDDDTITVGATCDNEADTTEDTTAYTDDEEAEDYDDDDDDDDDEDVEQVLVRLQLGEPDSDDYYACEIWHPRGVAMKQAKQKLASIALADLTDDNNNNGDENDIFFTDDDLDDDDDEEEDEEEESLLGVAKVGYDWELSQAVEGKVDTYLYGLLWNLQTYQDGVCADYSYNYGKRSSPLAHEIVDFFKQAKEEQCTVGRKDLRPNPFRPSISAGLSCLAALPLQVKELVPEPFRSIPDDLVEKHYATCMSPEDNVFDPQKFEQLCLDEIKRLKLDEKFFKSSNNNNDDGDIHDGRRIFLGDHFWTIISKVPKQLTNPFDPPKPFSDRLSRLKRNSRIRISRCLAASSPRLREGVVLEPDPHRHHHGFANKSGSVPSIIRHSDLGPNFSNVKNIDDVEYKVAYKQKQEQRRGLRKAKVTMTLQVKTDPPTLKDTAFNGRSDGRDYEKIGVGGNSDENENLNAETSQDQKKIESRMQKYNIKQPPSEPLKNIDGDTSMAILKQLADLELIGGIQWERINPSPSEYAKIDPQIHELIRLTVSKGKDPDTAVLHEDLVYEQDRDVTSTGRKAVQQHLASFALCDISGPTIRWTELSYKDFTRLLNEKKVKLDR